MKTSFTSGKKMIREIDKANFIGLMKSFYGHPRNYDLVTLEAQVRSDIKNKVKMMNMIEYTKTSSRDFFFLLIVAFPGMFNKFIIKRIKANLELD